MTDSELINRFLSAEFFALAKARLSLNTPEALTDPNVIPSHDDDADPAVLAAIAAMRPIRTAAVLGPIIARAEPTVLFTQRTAHFADHAGEIAFPGGKIEAVDASPAAAALREEEVSLDRRFVEPIGYLDVHVTPSGYRIPPVLACAKASRFASAAVRTMTPSKCPRFLDSTAKSSTRESGLERLDHERLCQLVQRPEDLEHDRRYTP